MRRTVAYASLYFLTMPKAGRVSTDGRLPSLRQPQFVPGLQLVVPLFGVPQQALHHCAYLSHHSLPNPCGGWLQSCARAGEMQSKSAINERRTELFLSRAFTGHSLLVDRRTRDLSTGPGASFAFSTLTNSPAPARGRRYGQRLPAVRRRCHASRVRHTRRPRRGR